MLCAAFFSVLGEDEPFLPGLLAQLESGGLPFAAHLDRCGYTAKCMVRQHRLCLGTTQQDDPAREFRETDKQGALDIVASAGARWALAWDVDERVERCGFSKLTLLHKVEADHAQAWWLNCWGDTQHVRIDGTFCRPARVKLLRLDGDRRWAFDHPITNGPKLRGREASLAGPEALDGLTFLHLGMMLPGQRAGKKARWDRIYSAALRGDPNPYGFWRLACDESVPAVTVRHGYW